MSDSMRLTRNEIAEALAKLDPAKYPPTGITPEQLGELLGYPRATIYEWITKGRFDGTFRKRGKGVRFWPERAIERFYNGPDWKDDE